MGNWCVSESPAVPGYREFEMAFQEHFETLAKRYIRVWDDGRIEVGTRNSPFVTEWSRQVLSDVTAATRNVNRARELLEGI